MSSTHGLATSDQVWHKLPTTTRREFVAECVGKLGKPGLHVFTDGSAKLSEGGSRSAGWGLAVLMQHGTHAGFLGCACGPVALKGEDSIGAGRLFNNTGELSAIAWAPVLSLRWGNMHEVFVHYGSQYAAGAVLAQQGLSVNVKLVHVARALLWQCRKKRGVQMVKVTAHSERPWNDLADAAAEWGRAGERLGMGWDKGPDAEAVLEAYRGRMCSDEPVQHWPCEHEQWEFHHGHWRLPTSVIFPGEVKDDAAKGKCQVSREWSFASANVLTLHHRESSHEVGLLVTARMVWMQTCFDQQGAHFQGIQEARTPEGARSMSEYMAISSGSEKGTLGCELWVSKKANVQLGEVAVSSSSPRHLLCAIRPKAVKVDVLVAHAPHVAHGIAKVEAWWRDLGQLVRGRREPKPLVCLVDANAHVGSVLSAAIGDGSAELQCEAGDVCHSFLLEHDLCLLATFGEPESPDEHTLTTPAGSRHRGDYVMLPLEWIGSVSKARVLSEVDLALAREDHRPVLVEVKLPRGRDRGCELFDRRPLRLNRELMKCPVRAQKFDDILAEVKVVPHEVGVDIHHYLLVKKIAQLASRFFVSDLKKPKKPWVSEVTWGIMQHAGSIRAGLAEWAKLAEALTLRRVLSAWHLEARCERAGWSQASQDEALSANLVWVEVSRAERVQLSMTRAALWWQLDQVCWMRVRAARIDKRNYAYSVAMRAQKAAEHSNNKELFACVKSLRPRKAKVAPTVKLENGESAATPVEGRQRWQRHFVELLQADVTTLAQLYEKQWVVRDTLELESAVAAMPTPEELGELLMSAKSGKAVGEDCLPGELFRAAPNQVLRLLYPLVLKMFTRVHAPLRWKGGLWHELYKGRGSLAVCKSFRGVLLEDHFAKIPAKVCRKALTVDFGQYALDEQCGGRVGRSIGFLFHMFRTFLERARHKGRCAATTFWDFVAAFDSLVREVVMGPIQTWDQFLAVVAKLLLDESDKCRLAQAVSTMQPVLESCGVSKAVGDITAELHRGTWFSTNGLETIAMTGLGSKPGCPLGDVTFNFLAACVFGDFRAEIKEDGTQVKVNWRPDQGPVVALEDTSEEGAQRLDLIDASFVDDDAGYLEAADMLSLVNLVARQTATFMKVAGRRGLRLNFEQGKTEVLIPWKGPKAKGMCKQVKSSGNTAQIAEHVHLRVVQSYKHVGSVIAASGTMTMRAAARTHSMLEAYAPLASSVFASRALSLCVRMMLAVSLLFSRLLLGAGSWAPLAPPALQKLATARMRVLRRMAAEMSTGTNRVATDEEILPRLKLERMDGVLRRARLLYWARVLTNDPQLLHALLQGEGGWKPSWSKAVCADLNMLKERTDGELATLPIPFPDMLPWTKFAAEDGRRWVRIVASVPSLAAIRCSEATEVVMTAYCEDCGRGFGTTTALATHAYRVHGHKRWERQFATGSHCPVCMTDLGTRMRAIHHLCHNSPKCPEKLHHGEYESLLPEHAAELDALGAAHGKRCKHKGVCPLAPAAAEVV